MPGLIITLVIVGLLLLMVELLVIPGFGVTGVLGIASFVGSCYLAFANIGTTVGIIVVVSEILLTVLSVLLILRSKTWKRLSLDTNIEAKIDEVPQNKGITVGMKGKAITRMAPAGQAEFEDVAIEVFSRGTVINAGCGVTVVEIAENKVFVEVLI